jgi:hypothetical protein
MLKLARANSSNNAIVRGSDMVVTELNKLPSSVCDLVNLALEQRRPMLLSYVGDDGQPVLSFRGSVRISGDTQLAIWVRNLHGSFCTRIKVAPKVALMYRNETSRATYQFQGRARLEEDTVVRDRVYHGIPDAEKNHDPSRSGALVLIDLNRVEGWAGMGPNGPIDPISMRKS